MTRPNPEATFGDLRSASRVRNRDRAQRRRYCNFQRVNRGQVKEVRTKDVLFEVTQPFETAYSITPLTKRDVYRRAQHGRSRSRCSNDEENGVCQITDGPLKPRRYKHQYAALDRSFTEALSHLVEPYDIALDEWNPEEHLESDLDTTVPLSELKTTYRSKSIKTNHKEITATTANSIEDLNPTTHDLRALTARRHHHRTALKRYAAYHDLYHLKHPLITSDNSNNIRPDIHAHTHRYVSQYYDHRSHRYSGRAPRHVLSREGRKHALQEVEEAVAVDEEMKGDDLERCANDDGVVTREFDVLGT